MEHGHPEPVHRALRQGGERADRAVRLRHHNHAHSHLRDHNGEPGRRAREEARGRAEPRPVRPFEGLGGRTPYLKSSGETWFIQSLNLSTTSSSGVSSMASSKTTPASAITSSEAKISAPERMARAMASDGLESTSTVLPSISSLMVAKNVESLSSVTVMLSIEPPNSLTRLRARSCVRGLTNSWFCSLNKIERASAWPIQIGK